MNAPQTSEAASAEVAAAPKKRRQGFLADLLRHKGGAFGLFEGENRRLWRAGGRDGHRRIQMQGRRGGLTSPA